MTWFRDRRKFGGWLALFALALQLALSFAHVHAEDFAGVVHPGVTVVATDHSAAGEGDGPGHDGCAICATVQLLGTLIVSTPPPGIAPPPFAFVPLLFATADASAPPARAPFQARGPPQA